jgi:hypothetical protein
LLHRDFDINPIKSRSSAGASHGPKEPLRIDALPHTTSIFALALSASMADGLADRCADQLDCEVAKVGRQGGIRDCRF